MAIDKFGEDFVAFPKNHVKAVDEEFKRMTAVMKLVEIKRIETLSKEKTLIDSSESSSSSSSDVDGSSQTTTEDDAPDGGWGWFVCAGSFAINFILDGTMFSFGIMLIGLLEYFGESKAKTSWVGSVLCGLSMILGPFVGWLLDRFTIRQVTLCGAVVAASGFVLSIFAPNVDILIITYGVIGGFGFCMMFIPAIIVVGLYFNRKRALATGIAMSGSGLGTFVYAYLCEALLTEFDWRGTVLILAGIVLNCLVCGALFRPLQKIQKRTVVHNSKTNACIPCCDVSVSSNSSSESAIDKTFLRVDRLKNENFFSNSTSALDRRSYDPNLLNCNRNTENRHQRMYSSVCDLDMEKLVEKENCKKFKPFNPLIKKDIFYSGSIKNLPRYNESSSEDSIYSQIKMDDTISEFDAEIEELDIENRVCKCMGKFDGTVQFRLFKNYKFDLLLICMMLWTAQSVTLTFLPDMAVANGIPRDQSAYLISICGVTNTIGRIMAGVLNDSFKVSSTLIYVVALLVASLVNFLFPWCSSFVTMSLCSAVFGLCMACAVCLRTIVIVEQLGIKKLTSAFSMIAFFQGIAFIINPPAAGLIYDMTDSYVFPFVMSGSMYLVSTVTCAIILFTKKTVAEEKTIAIVIDSENSSTDESLLDCNENH